METKPGHVPEAGKEKKETEPKITVDFFFAYHGTNEDYSRLSEALKNADVYVPEAVNWTKEGEEIINEISQGKTKPEVTLKSAKDKEEQLLYNRKIPVVLADIPENHPLVRGWDNATENTNDAYKEFFAGNFDEAIKKYKQSIIIEALIIKEREDFIVYQLKNELKTLTQKFPQLRNKKDINVLVTLGSAHTAVHHQLRSDSQSSKMILGRDTLIFSTHAEIIRRLIRNPKEIIDDGLYKKTFIEEYISQILSDTTEDSNKSAWAARKLAAKLSADQIQFLSEASGKLVAMKVPKADRRTVLIKKLEEMGIKLPTTEEEIDKLISIRKKTV
jgi:hypothetical protein